MTAERPPYPDERRGVCQGCGSFDVPLYRVGPPTFFRYRCSACLDPDAARTAREAAP